MNRLRLKSARGLVTTLSLILVVFSAIAPAARAQSPQDTQQPTQDDGKRFTCPDGTLVPLEVPHPFRCPNSESQRKANSDWYWRRDEAKAHEKETEDWIANYKTENDERIAAFQKKYQEQVRANSATERARPDLAKIGAEILVTVIDGEMQANESLADLNTAKAESLIKMRSSERRVHMISAEPSLSMAISNWMVDEIKREDKERTDRIGAIEAARADTREMLTRLKEAPSLVIQKAAAAEAAAKRRQAAAERARLALSCREIFKSTIDKKSADLTVRETQQITGCRASGLYHE